MNRHENQQLIHLESRIFLVRGCRVMLDSDLAAMYGVSTKAFNQAVKRNARRFPADFMFRLDDEEAERMRSQYVTASKRNVRYLPLVFTEQGIAMLSGILNSERAIDVNIAIMRAFIRLRSLVSANKKLSSRLDELEKKYDEQFKVVFDAIRALMSVPESPEKHIGFTAKDPQSSYKLVAK